MLITQKQKDIQAINKTLSMINKKIKKNPDLMPVT